MGWFVEVMDIFYSVLAVLAEERRWRVLQSAEVGELGEELLAIADLLQPPLCALTDS